jgi:hypothetical protein
MCSKNQTTAYTMVGQCYKLLVTQQHHCTLQQDNADCPATQQTSNYVHNLPLHFENGLSTT